MVKNINRSKYLGNFLFTEITKYRQIGIDNRLTKKPIGFFVREEESHAQKG
jgi:hypothetical protein